MGSSRDWAAKGTGLLGVRAVLACSFERIHRSNLIGMGILPLRLPKDVTPTNLNLSAKDAIIIEANENDLAPRMNVQVSIRRYHSDEFTFDATVAVETTLEVKILKSGGVLPRILESAKRQQPAERAH